MAISGVTLENGGGVGRSPPGTENVAAWTPTRSRIWVGASSSAPSWATMPSIVRRGMVASSTSWGSSPVGAGPVPWSNLASGVAGRDPAGEGGCAAGGRGDGGFDAAG